MHDLEEPQRPKLRVFRCYSKLFPLMPWGATAGSALKAPSASMPLPLVADARAASPAAAAPGSLVVLRGSKTEEAAAGTTATAASRAEVVVEGDFADAGKPITPHASSGTTVCASISASSWAPATASAPPSPAVVAGKHCSFESPFAAAAAGATAADTCEAAGAQPSAASWSQLLGALEGPPVAWGPSRAPVSPHSLTWRQSQRAAKRLRASFRRGRSRCRRNFSSCWHSKATGICSCASDPPTDHQGQQEQYKGELYDMVLHEILGDFASQEGAADVIRDIQERTGMIPRSIPFAARTFVGVSELPSPCCIKCPVRQFSAKAMSLHPISMAYRAYKLHACWAPVATASRVVAAADITAEPLPIVG